MSELGVDKKMVTRFAVLDGIYWGIMSSFGAYFVAWGLHRGFSQSFVSGMLIVYLISGLIGQFTLSSLCDKLRTNRKVFLLAVLIAGLAQLGMYFTQNLFVLAVCYAFYGFCLSPAGSVLDAWMIRSFKGNLTIYSSARGAGSIGYAVVMLSMGYSINIFGYVIMPICSTIIVIATLLVAVTTEEGPFPEKKDTRKITVGEIMSILKVPAYSVVLLILVLSSMTSAPINSFKIVLLEATGGDITIQGLDSFVGCVVQFLVFELTVICSRIPARVRLYISILMVTTALGMNYYATNYWVVIAATIFINSSYGLIMPAVREIAIVNVEPQYHTTAIGMLDACYNFLGGAIAQLYVGRIVEARGIRSMVMTCLVLSFIPVTVAFLEELKQRKMGGVRCQG